jgi:diadenosine tetraphosphate (Ap4A) HIT family hydrolase
MVRNGMEVGEGSGCEIAAGREVTPGGFICSSNLSTLTHHGNPHHATAGFVVLQPRRHVEHIADLTPDEAEGLGRMLQIVSRALMILLTPEKVYVCSLGSFVKHMRFYLIPKSADMPAGTELLDELADGRWACSEEETEVVAGSLRIELSKLSPWR